MLRKSTLGGIHTNKEKGSALSTSKGFTLLELLIVITIIAVLSVALIVVINPAETLRKARDTQRISDLAALKTAIGIYTTTVSSPTLGTGSSNAVCQGTTVGTWDANDDIYYSLDSGTAINTAQDLDGDADPDATQVNSTNLNKVDGNGWIPINFTAITGGSPISNLPIDPTNSVTTSAIDATTPSTVHRVNANALVYRYACATTNVTYEINATLESAAYGFPATGADDKMATDGGDSTFQYEVGTDLAIFGVNSTDNTTNGF